MIPIQRILRIELIDCSTRGSGSGQGGIINIRMEKVYTDGISGLISLGAETIDFLDLNSANGFLNINYKYKKVILFANISNSSSSNYTNSITEGRLNFNNSVFNIDESSNKIATSQISYNHTGIIYQPTNKTKIVISGGAYYYNFQNSYDIFKNLSIDNYQPFDEYNLIFEIKPEYKLISTGTFVTHSFDTLGKELTVGFAFEDYEVNTTENSLYNYNYILSQSNDSSFNTLKTNIFSYHLMYGSIYYNHAINENSRWNCGWTGYIYPDQQVIDNSSINEVPNLPANQNSKAQIQNHLFFVRYGTTINKIKLDGGISYQYDNIRADCKRFYSKNNDTIFAVDKKLYSILPSVTISYLFNNSKSLKFTYNRSVMPPCLEQYVDFIYKQYPNSWYSGNEHINKVNYDNFYLGYSINKEKWNFASDLFNSNTSNDILNVKYPISETITLTYPENIARKNITGLSLSSWLSVSKNCDVSVATDLTHSIIDESSLLKRINDLGLSEDNLNKKKFGYNVKISATIRLKYSITCMTQLNYRSKEITYTGINNDYLFSSLSVSKKILHESFLVSIGINNLFNELIQQGSSYNHMGMTQNTVISATNYKRSYFIRVKYIFRNGSRNTQNISTKG
jgi:hypothetical protein